MKNTKCIVFNFSKGTKFNTAYYHYKNGQLDLDLKIEEVRSAEPVYGSNVIDFKKRDKKRKSSSCRSGEEPSCTA